MTIKPDSRSSTLSFRIAKKSISILNFGGQDGGTMVLPRKKLIPFVHGYDRLCGDKVKIVDVSQTWVLFVCEIDFTKSKFKIVYLIYFCEFCFRRRNPALFGFRKCGTMKSHLFTIFLKFQMQKVSIFNETLIMQPKTFPTIYSIKN